MLGTKTYTEPKRLSDILKYELSTLFCRGAGILLAGDSAVRTVEMGAVLGQILFGTPTEDHTGNTGNGAMTGLALKSRAQLGDYSVECITATTNAATFAVFDPFGRRLADAATGAAYDNGEIAFSIADGGTDFVVGDSFAITVPAGSQKLTAIDFSAVDGSQRAAGVATLTATAPDGSDSSIAYLKRGPAVIASNDLVWPSGASAGQKAQALAELAALDIHAETAV